MKELVVFAIDGQRFAIDLYHVERIVRAVEVTRLPGAPATVYGVINVEGRVIPVLDTRRQLGLAERNIEPSDLFIIVTDPTTPEWSMAIIGDEVFPVMELPEEDVVLSRRVLAKAGFARGVAKVDGEMILLVAIDKTLSFEDRDKLHSAIQELGEVDDG